MNYYNISFKGNKKWKLFKFLTWSGHIWNIVFNSKNHVHRGSMTCKLVWQKLQTVTMQNYELQHGSVSWDIVSVLVNTKGTFLKVEKIEPVFLWYHYLAFTKLMWVYPNDPFNMEPSPQIQQVSSIYHPSKSAESWDL